MLINLIREQIELLYEHSKLDPLDLEFVETHCQHTADLARLAQLEDAKDSRKDS